MSSDGPRFEFVMVPDSEDARAFIELSSHAADLVQARDALEVAVRSRDEAGSPLRSAEDALIAAATMAYCRTFRSDVRRALTTLIDLPEALHDTHEMVREFRNRTIAHSQSDLQVTYALAVLDAQTLEVRDITAPTVSSTMPQERVRDFLELVTVVQESLDKAIAPLRRRLRKEIAALDRTALLGEGSRPTVRDMRAADFDPATSRVRYPTSHPIYFTYDVSD